MANHCVNRVLVHGTKEELEEFKNFMFHAAAPDLGYTSPNLFCLRNIIREPDTDNIDNERTWRKLNWGTSSDTYEHTEWLMTPCKFIPELWTISLDFFTAWTSPVYAYELLHNICEEKFPNISFEAHFYDPSCRVAGVFEEGSYIDLDHKESILYDHDLFLEEDEDEDITE